MEIYDIGHSDNRGYFYVDGRLAKIREQSKHKGYIHKFDSPVELFEHMTFLFNETKKLQQQHEQQELQT